MTFEELVVQRRVVAEPTGPDEISTLWRLFRRNIADATIEGLSIDGRFERAYGAARALATIVIRASGYRVRQPAGHYNTFLALEAADPEAFSSYAAYFDVCRVLRNRLSYEVADVVSETELDEILAKIRELEISVETWLSENHPAFAPS
jgi:hypothetical protein